MSDVEVFDHMFQTDGRPMKSYLGQVHARLSLHKPSPDQIAEAMEQVLESLRAAARMQGANAIAETCWGVDPFSDPVAILGTANAFTVGDKPSW